MDKYDLCIIGAGPSGYAAAMRAVDFGKRVVLIEKDKIGGAGLYNGALSSKTMWELSQKLRTINEGVESAGRKGVELSWEDVQKNLQAATFDRKFQYSCHIKLLQSEALNNIFKYERGLGTFIDNHHIEIQKNNNTTKTIYAENIIIATGSKPRSLPDIEVDEEIIMTSDGVDHMSDFPKSMVIVGAGVIGCEYATIFSNFGKTKVYLIDRSERVLPFEDEDISELISNNLIENGVTIHSKAQLERLEKKNGKVEYELSYKDGSKEVIKVDKALLSVGRKLNINGLKMENAGVTLSKRGVHIGDLNTQTNVPNIYVVGDASGHISLVNVGELEGRYAVEKIFAKTTSPINYSNICTIMFLQPEVASVGINEKNCIEQNIPIKVVKLDYSCIARAIAMRKTEGFFKIIVTDCKDMKILGMRAVGEHASSAIQGVGLLMKMDKTIHELAEMVHPHPSIIEGVQECVRMLLNKSIFKSSIFKDKLSCYRRKDGVVEHLQRL